MCSPLRLVARGIMHLQTLESLYGNPAVCVTWAACAGVVYNTTTCGHLKQRALQAADCSNTGMSFFMEHGMQWCKARVTLQAFACRVVQMARMVA